MGDFNIGTLQYRSGSNNGQPTYAPLNDFKPQGPGGFNAAPNTPFSMVMTNQAGTQYRVTGFWVDANRNGIYDQGDTIRMQMDRADLDPQFAQTLTFQNGQNTPVQPLTPQQQARLRARELQLRRAEIEQQIEALREQPADNTSMVDGGLALPGLGYAWRHDGVRVYLRWNPTTKRLERIGSNLELFRGQDGAMYERGNEGAGPVLTLYAPTNPLSLPNGQNIDSPLGTTNPAARIFLPNGETVPPEMISQGLADRRNNIMFVERNRLGNYLFKSDATDQQRGEVIDVIINQWRNNPPAGGILMPTGETQNGQPVMAARNINFNNANEVAELRAHLIQQSKNLSKKVQESGVNLNEPQNPEQTQFEVLLRLTGRQGAPQGVGAQFNFSPAELQLLRGALRPIERHAESFGQQWQRSAPIYLVSGNRVAVINRQLLAYLRAERLRLMREETNQQNIADGLVPAPGPQPQAALTPRQQLLAQINQLAVERQNIVQKSEDIHQRAQRPGGRSELVALEMPGGNLPTVQQQLAAPPGGAGPTFYRVNPNPAQGGGFLAINQPITVVVSNNGGLFERGNEGAGPVFVLHQTNQPLQVNGITLPSAPGAPRGKHQYYISGNRVSLTVEQALDYFYQRLRQILLEENGLQNQLAQMRN